MTDLLSIDQQIELLKKQKRELLMKEREKGWIDFVGELYADIVAEAAERKVIVSRVLKTLHRLHKETLVKQGLRWNGKPI